MIQGSFVRRIFVAATIVAATFMYEENIFAATSTSKPNERNKATTVRSDAINDIDVDWWDDDKKLLILELTFNFTVIATTSKSTDSFNTHQIFLRTTGTISQNFLNSYSGNEHKAVSKQFREIIQELRYEGNRDGKADLFIYLHKPARINYRMDKDLRTLRIELRLIEPEKPE